MEAYELIQPQQERLCHTLDHHYTATNKRDFAHLEEIQEQVSTLDTDVVPPQVWEMFIYIVIMILNRQEEFIQTGEDTTSQNFLVVSYITDSQPLIVIDCH